MAEFAHNPHTTKEILELARTALSLREDHLKFLKLHPEERGEALPSFSHNYGILQDKNPTPAAKDRSKWQLKVKRYFERLQDHYAFRNQPERWTRFGVPELGPGPLEDGDPTID